MYVFLDKPILKIKNNLLWILKILILIRHYYKTKAFKTYGKGILHICELIE